MPTINFRVKQDLEEKIIMFAQKNHESVSKYLRRLIEERLAVAEQNQTPAQSAINFDAQKKPELLVEYKRNLDFMLIEISALLHQIVKESGKFTAEEAKMIEYEALRKTDLYMRHYEKEEVEG